MNIDQRIKFFKSRIAEVDPLRFDLARTPDSFDRGLYAGMHIAYSKGVEALELVKDELDADVEYITVKAEEKQRGIAWKSSDLSVEEEIVEAERKLRINGYKYDTVWFNGCAYTMLVRYIMPTVFVIRACLPAYVETLILDKE